MSYHNTWEKHGLYRKFGQYTNANEVLESNLALQGDPRFDDIRYVVNDFSQLTNFDVNEIEIKHLAINDHVASHSNSRLKIAIIATLDELIDWIELYLEYMQESIYVCKIFNDRESAYKWVC